MKNLDLYLRISPCAILNWPLNETKGSRKTLTQDSRTILDNLRLYLFGLPARNLTLLTEISIRAADVILCRGNPHHTLERTLSQPKNSPSKRSKAVLVYCRFFSMAEKTQVTSRLEIYGMTCRTALALLENCEPLFV